MVSCSESVNSNQIAKLILAELGNSNPSIYQIELAESLLFKIVMSHKMVFHPNLTDREISCLIWAANGKTSRQTAELLKVKNSTVITWRKKIMRKLACDSMAQAVFQGIRYGYVK